MLADHQIREETRNPTGGLHIYPFREDQLQPCSYDVTLSNSFTTLLPQKVPMGVGEPLPTVTKCTDVYGLQPGRFVLASTEEEVRLSGSIAGRIEGKSSLARRGLIVHAAGFIDPGFHGQLTLEITNVGPNTLLLTRGMFIGQICFIRLEQPVETLYNGHYQGQRGATPSWY